MCVHLSLVLSCMIHSFVQLPLLALRLDMIEHLVILGFLFDIGIHAATTIMMMP